MQVNAMFILHNPASSGRGPWGLGGIRATWQVSDEGSHDTTLHQQARQTALLSFSQNNLLYQKLMWKVTRTAQGWCFSLQTQTWSPPGCLCANTKHKKKMLLSLLCCYSGSLPHSWRPPSLLSWAAALCASSPPDWIFDLLDIHFELESRAVAGHLTAVFEVFTLNDPGSPSGQLPYPELGEESSRQPADWAKIVWREQDLRLTGRTTLTHSNTRWLTGLWVKGVSEWRRYWAKSVFV